MMSWNKFYHHFNQLAEKHETPKAVWLKPSLSRIPLPIQRFDEPFFPLSRSIIQSTKDHVCAYIFDLASYLSTGAAGIVALERSIAYAKDDDAITILHGPFVGEAYSVLADDASLTIDGITVALESDLDYFIHHPPYGAFLYNGVNIEQGGMFNINTLSVSNKQHADIVCEVISSDILLEDFSEGYMVSIEAIIQK